MFPNELNGALICPTHLLKLTAIVLIVGSLSVDGEQTGDRTIDWTSRGVQLRKAGRYADAADAFQRALAVAESDNADPKEKISLHDALGSIYVEIGRFPDAVNEYGRALVLAESADTRNVLLHGLLLAKMVAVGGEDQSDTEMTSRLYAAITGSRQNASADQLAVMRVSLASLLSSRGKHRQAESLLQDALADLRADRSSSPRRMLDTLIAIGKLRSDQGSYAEAVKIDAEAIDLIETVGKAEQSTKALVLSNLSMGYMKMGRLQDAAEAGSRAVAIAGRTFGEDHPNYAIVLSNHAVLMRKLGRKGEAKEMAERSRTLENEYRRRNGVGSAISVTSLR